MTLSLVNKIVDDELRWLDKCENARMKIPYDAFRASLKTIKRAVERTQEEAGR